MNATKGVTKEDTLREVARRVLEDRISDVLVGKDEPAKVGEVMRTLRGDAVTMRLLRRTLSGSDRFQTVERRWMLASRFEDTQRPFERIVENIMKTYGHPMSVLDMSEELAYVFDRPAEHYETVMPRIVANKERYFKIGDKYGLVSWLLLPTSEVEDEVIFDNFLSEDEVAHFQPFAKGLDWSDPMAALVSMLDKAKEPVPLKIAALFALSALETDYDAVGFYSDATSDDRILLLSDQKLVGPAIKSKIDETIAAIAKEVEAMPLEPGEEAEGGPVEVSEADREEAVNMILKRGGTVSADDILENVLEVSEGEGEYEPALEKLTDALKEDDRVVWVGGTWWRPAGTIPEHVYEIPDMLVIPQYNPFETPEGDVYDQELEDEGLEGSLKTEIFNPLVQDIGDEDLDKSIVQPMDSYQRCVLKYHHKEAGTFPLCQINPAFFGKEPEVIQIALVGEDGARRDAWIDNRTRLMYDVKEWYQGEWPVSGGVFNIEKTDKPGIYKFVRQDENDPMVHVPNSRLFELLELKNEADTSDMSVYDIVTRIMEQHKKGVGFVTLFTEVNLVRRVTRRLVASILSSYHAFYQRPKTTEWQYDEKKRSQGFNKTKRKYIRK